MYMYYMDGNSIYDQKKETLKKLCQKNFFLVEKPHAKGHFRVPFSLFQARGSWERKKGRAREKIRED